MIPIKLRAIEKEIQRQIREKLQRRIDQELSHIVREIDRKTVIYTGLSILGLLLILIPLPQIFFYIAFGLMACALLYFAADFAKKSFRFYKKMGAFEALLTELVQKETGKARAESLKKRAGLFLSGLSERDIEDFCISSMVRELARRFQKKKKFLLARLAVYTVAVVLLQKAMAGLSGMVFWP